MPEGFDFAVSGINHNHIYGQVDALLGAGCRLKAFFAPEDDPVAQLDFKALVEKLPVVTDHKDLQKMTVSLAVSGPVTLT